MQNETMTIKEIADLSGLTKQTIINYIKKIYPAIIEHGKETRLTKDQALRVVGSLKIEVSKDLTVDTKDLTVENNDLYDMFKTFMAMQIETNKMLLNMMANNQPGKIAGTLEVMQDYYTLKGFMIKKGIKKTTTSELRMYGKMCSKLSRAKNIEIRKADDEQWGEINSYHVNILNEVFE